MANKVVTYNDTKTSSPLYCSKVSPQLYSYKEALLCKGNQITLKANTGASGNYIRKNDAFILDNINSTSTGLKVQLPDNSIITSTTEGNLPLHELPTAATKAHIFLAIKSASLLSIGQLCDSNCSALFTKQDLTIFNTTKDPILFGHHNTNDRL